MSSIKVFARIRPTAVWEKETKSIEVHNDAVGIAPNYNEKILKPIVNFYQFHHVFQQSSSNQDIFDNVLKSLCNNAAIAEKQKNAIFIAFGQTCSGKTHTILGSKGDKGILHSVVEHLLNHDNVEKIDIKIMESYGVKKNYIRIYDLLNDNAEVQLDGNGDHSKFVSKEIIPQERVKRMNQIVNQVRDNGFFAATARDAKSSRSHMLYTITITRKDEEKTQSNLLIVDLAGSDGQSAITKKFANKSHPKPLKERMNEKECIDYGLNRLKKCIKKYRNGGSYHKVISDISSLLYPFIKDIDQENKPKISILFHLSPSMTCITESRNTLRNAKIMTGCQIIPERCSWKQHQTDNNQEKFQQIVNEMQEHLYVNDNLNKSNIDQIAKNVRTSILKIQSIKAPKAMQISQNEWTDELAAKQQQLLDTQHYFLPGEAEKSYFALQSYRDDLQFALMMAENDDNPEFNDKELDEKKKKMITTQTRKSIQKELDSIKPAVQSSAKRLSQVTEIPLDQIVRVSTQKSSWLDLMDDDQDEHDQDDSEQDNNNQEEKKEEEFDLFDDYYDDPDDVNVNDLFGKQQQLFKYQRTLTQAMTVINEANQSKSESINLDLVEISNDNEATLIEKELAKVREELLAITNQVNKLNTHNNQIANALHFDHFDSKRNSEVGQFDDNNIQKDVRQIEAEQNNDNDNDDQVVNNDNDNDDHEDDDDDDDGNEIYRRPYPRYIEIRHKGKTANLIVRAIRCHEDLHIVGYEEDMSCACDIILKLEADKILKVVKMETGLEFSNYTQPLTCIKFLVVCGEFGELVQGYKQRKLIELFETEDKERVGQIEINKVRAFDLASKFKATAQQNRSANAFLRQLKEDVITMPDFVRYASRLLHPLMKDQYFDKIMKKMLN